MSPSPPTVPRLAPSLAAVLCLGAAGCSTLQVDEPIALVADGDGWTPVKRDALARAAECWNMRFGTRVTAASGARVDQEVRVGFSTFVCVFAAGRTDVTWPVAIHICPAELYYDKNPNLYLFHVILHELGHVLNIRPHASGPAVMNAGADGFADLPTRFTWEDVSLFQDANPDYAVPSTPTVLISYDGCFESKYR